MVLIDENNNKHYAVKCKSPRFKSKNNDWDSILKTIGSENYKFHFTVRANRSWFYFIYNDNWYKVNMVNNDGADLFDYNKILMVN